MPFCANFHQLDAPSEKRFPLDVKRCTNYITIVAFNSRAAVDIDVACFSVLTSPSRERVVRTRAQLQVRAKVNAESVSGMSEQNAKQDGRHMVADRKLISYDIICKQCPVLVDVNPDEGGFQLALFALCDASWSRKRVPVPLFIHTDRSCHR